MLTSVHTADPVVRREYEQRIADAQFALREGNAVLEELSREEADIQSLNKAYKEKQVSGHRVEYWKKLVSF